MKLGVVSENLMKRLALLFPLVPPGITESWFGIRLARTLMVATKLEILEALVGGPLTAEEVAGRCGTHPRATEKLLNALACMGCLNVRGERYELWRRLRSRIVRDS